MHFSNVRRNDGAEREGKSVTKDESNFSGRFCHDHFTDRAPTSPVDDAGNSRIGCEVHDSNATEEAIDDQHVNPDSSYSSADRTYGVQTDKSGTVRLAEVGCATHKENPIRDLPQPNVGHVGTPKIPSVVSRASPPNPAVAKSQLIRTEEVSQHEEKERPGSIEAAVPIGPASSQASSSLDPIIAFNSQITSREATSTTAHKDVVDSPPASLFKDCQNDGDAQLLLAPPRTDHSTRSRRSPSSGPESSSSYGFTGFASRAEIHRAFPHFRRLWSRTPTPDFDYMPQNMSTDGNPVEADENLSARDQQDGEHSMTEKPLSRTSRIFQKFQKTKSRCASSIEDWKRRKFHKETSGYDSSLSEPSVYPERSSPDQRLSSSLILPNLDFGADLGTQRRRNRHASLVAESEYEVGIARPLGPEEEILAPLNYSEHRASQISELDVLNGSWQYLSQQELPPTPLRRQAVDAHPADHSEEQIGVTRPLGPEEVVLTPQKRSGDITSEISEATPATNNRLYLPHLRGGARRHRDRFFNPRGDDAPINAWLWWFAGGRPLAGDSAPITRGFLRDWRRGSNAMESGISRSFGQEFMYTMSDGRWVSGRARARARVTGRDIDMSVMERERGSRMRSSSAPPGSAAVGAQPPDPGRVGLWDCTG